MKKIMILGAGAGQMPFINICKRKGAYVIVVSPEGEYPGIKAADRFYECDTREKEQILQIGRKEQIDAVTTDQTDVSVPSAAYVAEQMGLKGIGYQTSLLFTDKYKMYCAAKSAGVHVPPFARAESFGQAAKQLRRIGTPAVIKPCDSSGSRGVHRIDRVEQLEEYFEDSIRYSGTHAVVIEAFIQGREYLVDGFALDGKYRNLDLGIKEYFEKEGTYISKMCMFSSAALIDHPVERQVLRTNQMLVQGLGLDFGITHGEYIYSKEDGRVYLVEIAARGGGVYLSSDLTPKACGIHTNEMLLDYLLDGTVTDLDTLRLERKVSAWRCFACKEGVVKYIRNLEQVQKMEGVDRICLDGVKEGLRVKELTDDTTKYGPILVSANSRNACREILKRVESTLEIATEDQGKIYPVIW